MGVLKRKRLDGEAKMIISIDPGISGAIAVLSSPDDVARIWDMPIMKATSGKGNIVNPHLLADLLKEAVELGATDVYLEQVHSMPNQGVASTFKFGCSFGVIQGVAACLDLPILLVTPQRWKKYHGLIGKDKDACRVQAIECFPNQSDNLKRIKDGGRADAIMIGRFAWSRI